YICQKRISLTEYLDRWRSHITDVQKRPDGVMKHPKSVAVTWQTTLDQLTPDAIVLLNVLAWLAPEPVPLAVLKHLAFDSLAPLRPCCFHSKAASTAEAAKQATAEPEDAAIDDV